MLLTQLKKKRIEEQYLYFSVTVKYTYIIRDSACHTVCSKENLLSGLQQLHKSRLYDIYIKPY